MTEAAEERSQILTKILTRARYILLDFDGPVCDVFAGYPADQVADQLRAQFADRLPQPLPDDVARTDDPLHIIHRVAELAPALGPEVDRAVRTAELRAMATAGPTVGAVQFLQACSETGRLVSIVSNNSAEAIEKYLDLHQLVGHVKAIVGRDPDDPRLMKPNTYPLARAVDLLQADPTAMVMVGDSPTDIDAAHDYGIPVVGYVNEPAKTHTLGTADVQVTDMNQLAEASTLPN